MFLGFLQIIGGAGTNNSRTSWVSIRLREHELNSLLKRKSSGLCNRIAQRDNAAVRRKAAAGVGTSTLSIFFGDFLIPNNGSEVEDATLLIASEILTLFSGP